MQIDHLNVDQIIDLVVHRLFIDLSAEVMDYRVVTIQERFIKTVIDQANSYEEIFYNPLLFKLFESLTKTNEARRCLHYLFRVKCERIDTSFFTVKNLQKTYQKYKDIHSVATGTTQNEEVKSTNSTSRESITSSSGGLKTERE